MASIQGANTKPVAQKDGVKPTPTETKPKNQRLVSVFNAAVMSAKDESMRNKTKWDTNNDNDYSDEEMQVAINAIKAANNKTISSDRYTGKDETVKGGNSDAAKDAFYALNDAMEYDWTSTTSKKDDKNYNQFFYILLVQFLLNRQQKQPSLFQKLDYFV